jgi:hypothetical protein
VRVARTAAPELAPRRGLLAARGFWANRPNNEASGSDGQRCSRPERRMLKADPGGRSARSRCGFEFPRFQGLNLEPGAAPHMGFTAAGYARTGAQPSFISRMATPRSRGFWWSARAGGYTGRQRRGRCHGAPTIELDHPDAPVRIQLMSTALKARNVGDPATAREVDMIYARGGTLHAARNCLPGSATPCIRWSRRRSSTRPLRFVTGAPSKRSASPRSTRPAPITTPST